jgi:hypothetical protein
VFSHPFRNVICLACFAIVALTTVAQDPTKTGKAKPAQAKAQSLRAQVAEPLTIPERQRQENTWPDTDMLI